MVIDLNGEWRLSYLPGIRSDIDSLKDRPQGEAKTLPATVPGNVELDLVRAKVLPDPFKGSNIEKLRQYETFEWWYERQFDTPREIGGKRCELVFEGVDCYASYWLNGVHLGRTENALIEHRFDVTRLLVRSGANSLVVRLQSPILKAMEIEYEPLMAAAVNNWSSLWTRKPPHCYGWDIMPRALSAGLWRSVSVVVHEAVEIEDLFLYTLDVGARAADGAQKPAAVGLFYRLSMDPALFSECDLHVAGRCGSSRFESSHRVHFVAGKLELKVPDPSLWWPAGYGEASLYEVDVKLLSGGKVLASRGATLGIRTVQLDRSEVTTDDRPGQFLFRINGEPILCKGTNWVPADAFHSRDAGRYKQMLGMAVDLGCNMIRCWGGNVYEDHEFFDICDRAGIMIWQDFAMACAMYPQSEKFLAAFEREAASVVAKLRQHPSLVLWCGDNECDNMWPVPSDNRLTREVLPRVVARLDNTRPFVPSSPYWSAEAALGRNTDLLPERHLWRPRDYFKSERYKDHRAHFVGEIGYHGCPNVSSIERFIDSEYLWPWNDNPQWVLHGSESLGSTGPWAYRSQLMADQVREMFGEVPDNLREFAFRSQVAQAEAKKFFVEMTRLGKWRRTGVLWWNLIDGWPQFSDAIVDYYFGKKLAYHYIRRVQQPVCLMVDELKDWNVRVIAGNDSLREARGSFRVRDAERGDVLLEGPFVVPANENIALGACKLYHSDQKLLLIEWEVDGRKYGNHRLMGSPPFSPAAYRKWLGLIAALPYGFAAEDVAR